MTIRNHPTHIEDSNEIKLNIEDYNIELGTHLWGPAMKLPPHIARWLAKELEMMAAEVDRKAARAVCAVATGER